jgi:hypothetical protein
VDLNACEKIFGQALSSDSESAFVFAIEPLLKEYEILSVEIGRGLTYWRARIINGEPYSNVRDLGYPPRELVKEGRVNDRGVPAFYISERKETALAEIEAREGQLVQLAGFRIKVDSPLRLAVFGEFANVEKNGYMRFCGQDPNSTIAQRLNAVPRRDALKRLYIDRFFAHILADADASANGYRFSRALAASIYSKIPADGIAYPSVKDRGGFNIAVKAEPSDKSILNVCCMVVRMGKSREFGLVEYEIVKTVHGLDDKWNFIWSQTTDKEIIRMYNLTKEEFDSAPRI